jgi:hypothetical protein
VDGVDDASIARWRAHTMRLWGQTFPSAEAVVDGMLAVQGENPSQAAWAVATRTATPCQDTYDRAFDDGALLRTHVLRPTWHLVRPDDIRWLLDVTRPGIRRSYAQQQRSLGVEDATLHRARDLIVATLDDGQPRTRPELGKVLAAAGLPGEGSPLGLLLSDAELEALICSGPLRDGQHTHVMLEHRAPHARQLDRDAALAALALRYVRSHGPVTERDLAYWASLTLTDARAGLSAVADQLDTFVHDGRRFWFHDPPPPTDVPVEPRAHLLQTLDEIHNGVQDSRHVLDVARLRPAGRPVSVGMVLVDTQIVGGMRRTVADRRVRFDLQLLRDLDGDETAAVHDAAARYGAFLDREPVVLGAR